MAKVILSGFRSDDAEAALQAAMRSAEKCNEKSAAEQLAAAARLLHNARGDKALERLHSARRVLGARGLLGRGILDALSTQDWSLVSMTCEEAHRSPCQVEIECLKFAPSGDKPPEAKFADYVVTCPGDASWRTVLHNFGDSVRRVAGREVRSENAEDAVRSGLNRAALLELDCLLSEGEDVDAPLFPERSRADRIDAYFSAGVMFLQDATLVAVRLPKKLLPAVADDDLRGLDEEDRCRAKLISRHYGSGASAKLADHGDGMVTMEFEVPPQMRAGRTARRKKVLSAGPMQ